MRHFWLTLVLAAALVLALPLAASALGLAVEANAGGGLGLGSTNNSNETGSARLALQGGVEADLFLVTLGPVDLGVSTGLEYDNLTLHGVVTETIPGPTTVTVNSDNNYVYLIVPLAISARMPLSQSMNLSLRAGGFFGHFMGGQSTNISTSPNVGFPSSQTFDSSNVPTTLLGLHFSGGVDFGLGGGLFVSPSVIFNMGLTNTTGSSSAPFNQNNYTFSDGKTYTDSLWSLTLMIGVKYNVL